MAYLKFSNQKFSVVVDATKNKSFSNDVRKNLFNIDCFKREYLKRDVNPRSLSF